MVCSVNIGNELSAAVLTGGLGTAVKRTNICRIGFRVQDIVILLSLLIVYILFMFGKVGAVI